MKFALALLAVLYLLQCTQEGLASPIPEGSSEESDKKNAEAPEEPAAEEVDEAPKGRNVVLEKESQKQAALEHKAKSSLNKQSQKSVVADQESNTVSGYSESSKTKLKIPVADKKKGK